MNEILDQWEKEALENKPTRNHSLALRQSSEPHDRILTLIELVRKKDEMNRLNLHRIITFSQLRPASILNTIIDCQSNALALTDKLK